MFSGTGHSEEEAQQRSADVAAGKPVGRLYLISADVAAGKPVGRLYLKWADIAAGKPGVRFHLIFADRSSLFNLNQGLIKSYHKDEGNVHK